MPGEDTTRRVRAVAEKALQDDPAAKVVFSLALDASSYHVSSDGPRTTIYLSSVYEPFIRAIREANGTT